MCSLSCLFWSSWNASRYPYPSEMFLDVVVILWIFSRLMSRCVYFCAAKVRQNLCRDYKRSHLLISACHKINSNEHRSFLTAWSKAHCMGVLLLTSMHFGSDLLWWGAVELKWLRSYSWPRWPCLDPCCRTCSCWRWSSKGSQTAQRGLTGSEWSPGKDVKETFSWRESLPAEHTGVEGSIILLYFYFFEANCKTLAGVGGRKWLRETLLGAGHWCLLQVSGPEPSGVGGRGLPYQPPLFQRA